MNKREPELKELNSEYKRLLEIPAPRDSETDRKIRAIEAQLAHRVSK